LTTRTIEGKENNYDNLKDVSFGLTREIRDKDYAGVLVFAKARWADYQPILPELAKLKYAKSDRSDMLHVLARIACYLEDAFALTNRVGFTTYWQRDRGTRTFDIEHLLKDPFDVAALPSAHGFSDAKDYGESRNLIGALALLPRSRNRSLQDKPYREKLAVYATENVLTQTLCDAFYLNNPNVAAHAAANPALGVGPIADFAKADIAKRAALYVAAAQKVWETP